MARVAGLQSLSINGVNYSTSRPITYTVGTIQRAEMVNWDGSVDYSETPVAGSITVAIRDDGTVPVSEFHRMVNATVVADLANGKQVIGTNVFVTEPPNVDTAEGTFEVTFKGADISEA